MKDTEKKPATGFTITGDWGMQSKKLKEKYDQLTDSDLKFESGKENELFERLETKLHKNREEVINIVKKTQPVKA